MRRAWSLSRMEASEYLASGQAFKFIEKIVPEWMPKGLCLPLAGVVRD